MNKSTLKVLSLVLIFIGMVSVVWLDSTKGLDTPLLWFTHIGVFLALILLSFESAKRAILPLLLWVATYAYEIVTTNSLIHHTDNPFGLWRASYEGLFVTHVLGLIATIATGIALFVHPKPKQ